MENFVSILYSIAAFVAAIGILVTIHEFGHFWVARKMGVKVLRFSVGFGKPLWTKKAGLDQTEYVLACIPLGGYVKMLDEREGDVAENELDRTFNRKSVWRRFAIVAAGPMFNFLFAIVAYSLIYMMGIVGV
jgi:regulator of sigma E protease